MKIVIFKKNSPWGVLKVPQKGNVYRHCLTFLDRDNNFSQNLKDEFINEYLADAGKTYLQMLAEQVDQPWDPQNELIFNFKANAKSQKNRMSYRELQLSDFCMTKDDAGEILFGTLKVLKTEANFIYFEAEIDILFSYHLQFRQNSQNNILQGHVDRGKNNNSPNYEFMMTQEQELNVEPSLHEKEKFDWFISSKLNPATKNIGRKIKGMVVYIKNNIRVKITQNVYQNVGSGAGSQGGAVASQREQSVIQGDENGTKFGYNKKNLYLPYQILIVPMLTDNYEIKYQFTGQSQKWDFNPAYFISSFNDKETIVSVHLLDSMPLRFDTYSSINSVNLSGKELLITGSTTSNSGYHFNKDGFFVIDNINLFNFGEALQGASIIAKGQVPKLPTNNIVGGLQLESEPKLGFHQFYNVSIKTGNGENKIYYPYWMKITNGKGSLRKMYTFQPENMSELVWFEGITKHDNLHMGNVLNHKVIQEIPTSQSAYIKYLRENKNTLQTGVKYDNIAQAMSSVGMVIGLGTSIFSGSPTTAIGSVFAGTTGIISSHKSLEMRESKLKDIQNFIPNVDASNNLLINMFFHKLDREGIIISHNYLIPEHQRIVLEYFNEFGYTIKRILPLEIFTKTRYRYNFIRADDVFNSIKNKFSPSIKQTISSAFAEGITFWNYRDKNTGRGIMTYQFENGEVSVLKRIGKY